MQNYYTPEICLGTTEPNGNIFVKDDYNWELYNISSNPPRYWDDSFKAKLTTGSNISYASVPLSGARRSQQWRDTYDSKFAMIGNRGVKDGEFDRKSHLSYEIHGGRKQWLGNVVFNDNHNEVLKTFLPEGKNYTLGGDSHPDNLFKNDMGATADEGTDCWLIVVSRLAGAGTIKTIEWDEGPEDL